MYFESVLMTFYDKSDEQIAYERLVEANEELKAIKNGVACTEESIKALMKKFLDAFWVYKAYDLNIAMDIAINIHSLGYILATSYGCKWIFDTKGKTYYMACPAMLLHCDFGFSIRAFVKFKCSICGKPVLECNHLTGDYYDDVECWYDKNGECNICGQINCKSHNVRKRYDHVKAYKIPYDLKLITFDMVPNPKMKYARVTKIHYSEDDIMEFLSTSDRDEFVFGKSELYCSHCMICEGFKPGVYDSLFQR